MNIVLIFFSSFIIALSGALVPGPLFTITVSESLRRGFKTGPLIIFGHGLLEITIVILLFFGISPFLLEERTRQFISVAGGIILMIMGVMLFRDAGKTRLDLSPGERQTGLHPVISGILGSLSNPYWIIWWVTIGLGYLVSSLRYGIPGVIAFFSGHISADLLWYSMISYAVSRGQKIMGERGYRYLLSACGIFLIFFGGWFLAGV
ncbi:MAG: lysine transporter LysE [Nitrospirae bacterium]|nr:lysine transporter LysE [Nitrospirota bacterium]